MQAVLSPHAAAMLYRQFDVTADGLTARIFPGWPSTRDRSFFWRDGDRSSLDEGLEPTQRVVPLP